MQEEIMPLKSDDLIRDNTDMTSVLKIFSRLLKKGILHRSLLQGRYSQTLTSKLVMTNADIHELCIAEKNRNQINFHKEHWKNGTHSQHCP